MKRYWWISLIAVLVLVSSMNPTRANNAHSQSAFDQKIQTLRQKVPTAEFSEPYITSNTSKAEYWYDLERLYRHQSKKYAETDTKLANRWDTKAKDVFLKGVKKDMQKPNAEQILQPYYQHDLIEKVEWQPSENSTNLDELVYQKNKSPEQRKPTLVLFYTKSPTGDGEHHYTKRGSIVFKRLAEKYHKNIDSITYPTPPVTATTEKEINKVEELESHNIQADPSIAMYSPYDVLDGETPKNNDGVVEQIDILKGGPKKNKLIKEWIEVTANTWIPLNLTDLNYKYTGRYNNSAYLLKKKY